MTRRAYTVADITARLRADIRHHRNRAMECGDSRITAEIETAALEEIVALRAEVQRVRNNEAKRARRVAA